VSEPAPRSQTDYQVRFEWGSAGAAAKSRLSAPASKNQLTPSGAISHCPVLNGCPGSVQRTRGSDSLGSDSRNSVCRLLSALRGTHAIWNLVSNVREHFAQDSARVGLRYR
jgi:hypothetical protein